MQDEMSSSNSNGNSNGNSNSNSNVVEQGGHETVYKCARCPKVFKSGRARGGHQNVHRERPVLRTYKGKKLSELNPVLAASLSRHVPDPDNDNDQSKTSNQPENIIINAGVEGSSTQQNNHVVQPKPKANKEASSSLYHPYQKKPQQELRTIDFLAGWNCAWNPSVDKTTTGPVARVSMDKTDHDLNLKLKLCSSNPNTTNLELKLGL